MDALRAQRREYNDLYRAHQATTTQDALKMDVMLSMLAAQNANTNASSANANAPNNATMHANANGNVHRENYPTRPHQMQDATLARRAQTKPSNITSNIGFARSGPGSLNNADLLLGTQTLSRHGSHPAHDLLRQNDATQLAALFGGSRQNNNGGNGNNGYADNNVFRFRSPALPHSDFHDRPGQQFSDIEDYEFAQRRQASLHHVPGVCAKQVLESPADAWGLHAILRKIRASTPGIGDHGDAVHWPEHKAALGHSLPSTELNTPVDGPSLDVPTPTKGSDANRLSIPSATSEDSIRVYDYFGADADAPLTPTTSAYSDIHVQPSFNACIVRISGARYSDFHLSQLVPLIARVVSQSPLVQRAAFTACETLDDDAPLGEFVPSGDDVSVKILFSSTEPGNLYENAKDIFHVFGGCILVKSLPEYVLEPEDEPFVETTHPTHPRRRARRYRGLMQDGIVPPDGAMLSQIFEHRVRAGAQPVDRLAMQLREYGVDVAPFAR